MQGAWLIVPSTTAAIRMTLGQCKSGIQGGRDRAFGTSCLLRESAWAMWVWAVGWTCDGGGGRSGGVRGWWLGQGLGWVRGFRAWLSKVGVGV
jgi:hypothetical protein